MSLDQGSILFGERVGDDRQLVAALDVLEGRWLEVGELDLGGIQHVEENYVVAAEPQRHYRAENLVGLGVEVGDDDNDAAPAEVLGQLLERRADVTGSLGRGSIDRVQHHVEVLGRGRDVVDHVVVEGYQADAIALLVNEIGQACRVPFCRDASGWA